MQLKPDWSKAPEWANWWAIDRTGDAYWFKQKPMLSGGFWLDKDTCMLAENTYFKSSLTKRSKGG
jgi:hypothetical protein